MAFTMSDYPSAADYPIAYNVLDGGVLSDSPLEGQPVRLVNSCQPIKALSWNESNRISKRAYRSVKEFVRNLQFPKLTELHERVWSLANVGDPIGDRTLPMVFNHLPLADVELISLLQSGVLLEFPEWRVLHCESRDTLDLNLAVYPDAISVGHEVFDRDFQDHLSRWRRDVRAFREPLDGPMRRQLNVLQRAILERPRGHWSRSAPVIMSAFDNHNGDRSFQSIWLLLRSDSEYELEINALDNVCEGNSYPIMNNGRIGELLGPASPSGMWIRQIVVPTRDSHVVSVRGESGNVIASFQVHEFKEDADLARDEEEAID